MLSLTLIVLSTILYCTSGSQTLPPVVWDNGASSSINLDDLSRTILLDASFAEVRDSNGLTLIPPSAAEFAQTFVDDANELFEGEWALQISNETSLEQPVIVLGQYTGDENLAYQDGQPSEESYVITITTTRVFVNGTGARGMWWGTRTVLQQLLQSKTLPQGEVADAPAYATRGYMLDAGRKWYAPSMLKELCTYASFFKMSEFHYHASDNYPLSRGRNETWQNVYSHFSFWPDDERLQDIVENRNESLSRAEFEDLQSHCAQRGVTVIPEIEAPGHCLAITKWRPELALTKKDLLNLTHPDAIPTIQAIWSEFLPWFQTKEVHIGADEYDSDLADDYIRFVNEMSDFVNKTSGKRIRIWGTYEPSENLTISQDIVTQHWQYGQSDPVQLERDGYTIINSEDWWAYMTLKNDHTPILPAPYPQFYNITRILNFANVLGWQWQPADYNPVNATEQLSNTTSLNRGAILAAWNDNGPDATTQLEAYYAMRDGIPLVAARAWSGTRDPLLDTTSFTLDSLILTSQAPGQNLDRRVRNVNNTQCAPFITWIAPTNVTSVVDTTLGYGSKGLPHTLLLSVTGPFTLSSNDSTLSLLPSGSLVYTNDRGDYPLRSIAAADGYDPGHPGRIWTNLTSSSHEEVLIPLSSDSASPTQIEVRTDVIGGSRVWVNGAFAGRFEVFVYGGRNTIFSWSQMAFVAPLERVDGLVRRIDVGGCLGFEDGEGNGTVTVYTGGAKSVESFLALLATLVVMASVSALLV